MRITQGMLHDRLLTDLRAGLREVATTQREVASGSRLQRPSDDPVATALALSRRSELAGVDAHRKGAQDATAWLQATDETLGRVTDVLARARELAVQGSNGTVSAADRQRLAAEVDQLAAGARDLANAQQGGRFLFGGTATTAQPYPGTDVYAGSATPLTRQVGPGVTVTATTLGSAVFGSGQTANDGKALDVLRDLADALRAGTKPDLVALDAAADVVATVRTDVGAIQNRVDAALTRLDEAQDLATRALGEHEGVDLPEALMRLSNQRTAYEAALQTGARVVQTSLLDFLR
jgi:flagellar hook-associated protein 3 FlgL